MSNQDYIALVRMDSQGYIALLHMNTKDLDYEDLISSIILEKIGLVLTRHMQ